MDSRNYVIYLKAYYYGGEGSAFWADDHPYITDKLELADKFTFIQAVHRHSRQESPEIWEIITIDEAEIISIMQS